jgi:hypothetical protein
MRKAISDALEEVLQRGRDDGTVRRDVTAVDIIITGAQLAQPLAHVPDWDQVAHRQAAIFLAGLGAKASAALPGRGATRADLETAFSRAQKDRPL